MTAAVTIDPQARTVRVSTKGASVTHGPAQDDVELLSLILELLASGALGPASTAGAVAEALYDAVLLHRKAVRRRFTRPIPTL